MKKILLIIAVVLLAYTGARAQAGVLGLFRANYFVADDGNDANSGKYPWAPIQTIAKLNTLELTPGQIVAFKRGDVFDDTTLVVADSGTSGKPITYTWYGNTGAKPVVNTIIVDTLVYSNVAIKNIDGDKYYNKPYFVSNTGNDTNNGLTPETPWATIDKVEASTLAPGDQILFNKGDTWRETLVVPSSGTSGNPIVFGAYGTGDNPVIDGADVITGMVPYQLPDTAWYVALPLNSTNTTYYNLRQVLIPTKSGTKIRVKFKGPQAGTNTISGASIGERSGTTSSTTATPIRLTFNGENTVTLPTNTVIYSDYIDFTIVSGTSYLVHVWMENPNDYPYVASGSAYRSTTSTDFTLTQNPSIGSASTATRLVEQIDIPGDTVLNNWEKTGIATQPYLLYLNGTVGVPQTNEANCDTVGQWYWNSTTKTLRVYNTTDPSGDVELGQRNTLVNLNGKDYITLNNLTIQHSNDANGSFGQSWKAGVYAATTSEGANYFTMEGCTVQKCGYLGIYIRNSKYLTFNNNTITRNGETSKDYSNVHLSTNSAGAMSNIIFTNNINTNSGGDGLLITADTKANHIKNIVISGNTFNNHPNSGVYVQTSDSVFINNNTFDSNGDATDPGEDYAIAIGTSDSVRIYNNTITNQLNNDAIQTWSGTDASFTSANVRIYNNYIDGVNAGNGIGMNAYGDSTSNNMMVYYNVIANVSGFGISASHNEDGSVPSTIQIYNNTIFESGIRSINTTANFPYILRNNIMYKNSSPAEYNINANTSTSGLTTSNNLWKSNASGVLKYNGNTYTAATITTFESTAQTGDPLFTDAANADFTLQTGSPAINNGVDVGLTTDILGNPVPADSVSIGAYQYVP